MFLYQVSPGLKDKVVNRDYRDAADTEQLSFIQHNVVIQVSQPKSLI